MSRLLVKLALPCLCALAVACVGNQDQPQFTLSRRPIINGTTDTTDTSVVALVYQGEQFCTGTVIASQWILSAGHCLVEMASQTPGFKATDCKIFFGTTVGSSGQSISVTEAHAHPSYYTRSDGAPMYDVSVWKLASAAPVAAMPWQQTSLSNPTGSTVNLVGYGVTNASQQTGNGTRRQVDAQVSQMDSSFLYYGNGYSGTCQGDSGGPMFLNGVVIGVCSFGDQSCVQEGANTRVDIYASFIQQYVGSTTQPQPVTVAITSPANGSTQGAAFAVSATVTSTAGVASAALLLDGNVTQTLTAQPWSFNLSGVAAGSHQIVVKGTGSDGGTGQASISVTVSAPATGCSSSNPCATGYDCVNGQCVAHVTTGCSATNPCAQGLQCVNGQCVPELATGCSATNPCGAGYDCMNGACVAVGTTGASCTTNAQCSAGICVADGATGYCSQACTSENDCPNQSSCQSVSGMSLCGPPNSAATLTSSGSHELSSGCSAARGAGVPASSALLLALGLVLALRKRRIRAH